MSVDQIPDLARRIGEVAGALGGVQEALGQVDQRLGNVEAGMAEGGKQFQKLDARMDAMIEQQKIANGRTAKNERTLEHQSKRIGLLEQWRYAMTTIPRTFDKLAEHKAWGLFITIPITSGLTIALYRLFS
jgi:chromosome segregation ATPase